MRHRIFGWFVALLVLLLSMSAPVSAGSPESPIDELNRIEVLDLAAAARIALAANPSLAAAQARVMQAAQIVRQAQAPYWPQLDASAGVSRVDLSQRDVDAQLGSYNLIRSLHPTAGLPPADISNPEDYYQAGLSASWLVFDGFARKFRLAEARYGEQASAAARDDAQRLLLSAVTFAYLQAQLARENVAIAKADEAFNQRLLMESRLRYDVGTGALSDVLNFQIRGNSAQSQRIQQERGYREGLITLAALMGVPQGRLPDQVRLADMVLPTAEELAAPQSPELVETAMRLRPDLKRGDMIVQQAEAGVETARAGYFPTVSLSASYTGERPEDINFEGDDFGNTVGLGLNWNLFSGGLTRARHGEAKARLYETERAQEDVRVRVASEVQKIANQISASQEQLLLQETNTQLVQKQRDLVEKEYKAGVGSLVRLNEAQRDLTVSLAQLALARVALRVSWYDLQTATGQILETLK
ncbi:MAG: TolC family protein [Desulfatitalea sp.]